jgi:hypothetical protein
MPAPPSPTRPLSVHRIANGNGAIGPPAHWDCVGENCSGSLLTRRVVLAPQPSREESDQIRRRGYSRLSADEAKQALYIDFEGEKDKSPVLLGVMRRPGRGPQPFLVQDAIDQTFAPLASRVLTLQAAVENVVRRAESRECRIVAWSEHELEIVQTLEDEDPQLVARFESRFANARAIAVRWRNKLYAGDKPTQGRLADYLALIGYPLPPGANGGQVGDTVRRIRRRLEYGRSLTAADQQAWSRLIEHNRHDCGGMRKVCLKATAELDAFE